MENTYQQIQNLINSLRSLLEQDAQISLIERDILMEQLRQLYTRISAITVTEEPTEAVAAPIPPVAEEKPEEPTPVEDLEPIVEELSHEEEKYNTHAKMEEDVDLFFSLDLPQKDGEEEPQPTDEERIDDIMSELFDEAKDQPATGTEEDDLLLFAEKNKPAEVKPEPKLEEKIVEEKPIEKPVEVKPEPRPVEKTVEVKPVEKPVEVKPEPKPVEKPAEVKTEPKTDEPKVEIPRPQTTKPAEPVIPKVAASQRSLNDLFTPKNEDRSVAGQFQQSKVVDLTKAISVNDKFTFIRELFNNRGEEFSSAIHKLNQCKDMDEAFNCLEDLKKAHFWDTTSTAYLSLCDLIRRRYL
ncbi:MAG: hypothetical protein K6A41_00835 [Bacteroidales bacterium]|nr:hypothetical protein [Bacteroidales bacterium]